jgi:TatD DNase family protein
MFDSHCHLTDEQFAGAVDDVIARALAAGVQGMVTIASDAGDAAAAHALAARQTAIWSTAGIHPHAAGPATADDRAQVRTLLGLERVVAIGETGLDYHYDNSPRDVQRALFDWHLALAAELDKPVIVHARNADEDVTSAVRGARGVRGVLHCFSGGAELLEAALGADWYVSFAGPVSFKRFTGEALLRAVPADRLLIETDSPYLAPVPYRGKRNEPAYLPHTCAAVARWRDEDPQAVGALCARNARAFYRLDAAQHHGRTV